MAERSLSPDLYGEEDVEPPEVETVIHAASDVELQKTETIDSCVIKSRQSCASIDLALLGDFPKAETPAAPEKSEYDGLKQTWEIVHSYATVNSEERVYDAYYYHHDTQYHLQLHASDLRNYQETKEKLIKKFNAFIVIFSVTSAASFNQATLFIQDILDIKDRDVTEIPFVLVGNMSDGKEKRQVPTDAAMNCAAFYGKTYVETSAWSGKNGAVPFFELVRDYEQAAPLLPQHHRRRSETERQEDLPVLVLGAPTVGRCTLCMSAGLGHGGILDTSAIFRCGKPSVISPESCQPDKERRRTFSLISVFKSSHTCQLAKATMA
eukprot:Colp12_sorted_trinity150504_noHs@29289